MQSKIIKNPLKEGASVVSALHKASFTITPDDTIIQRGNTIILRKPMKGAVNHDGSQKYHDQFIDLGQ